MMSDSKSNPSLPAVREGEQFVSAQAFASANSSGEWDALAPRSGTPSNGQEHNQHRGLSRLERDSLYKKFDPLLSIKKEEGAASSEEPSDRLSSVFKIPLLAGSRGGEADKNMEMEASMTSPQSESGSSYKSAYQQADMSLSTSQLFGDEDSRPNSTDQNWDAEKTIYLSAQDLECSSYDHGNLNGTVIPGNSSILKEACKSNGDEMGSPDASHDSTAGAAPNKDDCNTSVFSESLLGKFNSVLVISTPPAVKAVRFAEEEEKEIDLNGSLNVTPPSPLDSLNVTQILVDVDDDDNASEKITIVAPLEEDGLLDESITPVINRSFVEENHVSNLASSSSLEPALEFQIDNQMAAITESNQEQILRIQELKAQLAQMDQEYIEYCESSKKMLLEKEEKLYAVLKLEEKEMGELGRFEARKSQLKLEKDKALEDLKLWEAEFADMLGMYEQIKELSTLIERNYVTLNERKERLDKSLDDKEERNAAAKEMVNETLETMQADFHKKFPHLEAENIKLKARIRLIDMATEQKTAKIAQLDKENEQLRSLCDNLVASK